MRESESNRLRELHDAAVRRELCVSCRVRDNPNTRTTHVSDARRARWKADAAAAPLRPSAVGVDDRRALEVDGERQRLPRGVRRLLDEADRIGPLARVARRARGSTAPRPRRRPDAPPRAARGSAGRSRASPARGSAGAACPRWPASSSSGLWMSAAMSSADRDTLNTASACGTDSGCRRAGERRRHLVLGHEHERRDAAVHDELLVPGTLGRDPRDRESAEERGRDVVGVALELGRELEELVGRELDDALEQALRRHHARDDRGARRAEAAPVGDRVVRHEAQRRHRHAGAREGVRDRRARRGATRRAAPRRRRRRAPGCRGSRHPSPRPRARRSGRARGRACRSRGRGSPRSRAPSRARCDRRATGRRRGRQWRRRS